MHSISLSIPKSVLLDSRPKQQSRLVASITEAVRPFWHEQIEFLPVDTKHQEIITLIETRLGDIYNKGGFSRISDLLPVSVRPEYHDYAMAIIKRILIEHSIIVIFISCFVNDVWIWVSPPRKIETVPRWRLVRYSLFFLISLATTMENINIFMRTNAIYL